MSDKHTVEHQLASVIVHQLRNRLSRVVFGADALLKETQASPSAQSVAARFKRGVDELTRWADQLVELTQQLTGDVDLRVEQLDLRAIVYDAVERAQPLLAVRRHAITLEGLDDPVPIEGDRLGLELVVANLLSNAAKFTRPGGNIVVRAVSAKASVHLYVIDDGIGIAPDRLADVFELQGGEGEEQGASRHVHAGLFLVRRVAELHGGSAHVRSGERKGTEVVVCIPRATLLGHTSRTPRALVVSDGRTGGLAIILRSRGYQVDVAQSGAQALDLARDLSWEVVLVDASLAVREEGLAGRLRDASVGATLLLVGTGPRTLGMAAQYDGALAAGFDADLLHASIATR